MRGLGGLILAIGIIVFIVVSILAAEGVVDFGRAQFYLTLFAQAFIWVGIALFAGGARSAQAGARMPAYYQQAPMGQPAQMGQPYAPYAGAAATTAVSPAVTQQTASVPGASTSTQCASCGAPLAPGAAFCGNCGAKS